MFDPSSFMLGGIQLLAFVFGFTEFIKHMFNLDGKIVTAISMSVGVMVMGAYQAMELLPGLYGDILRLVFVSIAFGLSASGYYKYLNDRVPKNGQN